MRTRKSTGVIAEWDKLLVTIGGTQTKKKPKPVRQPAPASNDEAV